MNELTEKELQLLRGLLENKVIDEYAVEDRLTFDKIADKLDDLLDILN